MASSSFHTAPARAYAHKRHITMFERSHILFNAKLKFRPFSERMEVSSFQFLNTEEISHLYYLLPAMDDATDRNSTNTTTIDDLKKWSWTQSEEDVDCKTRTMRDAVASFLLFEDEEDEDREAHLWDFDTSIPAHEAQQIDLYNQPQDLERNRNKKPRRGASAAESSTSSRRLWVKDRSKDWWEKCSSPDFPDEEFKKGFRMSKATFDMICEELESAVTKKNTMLREAIPVRQRVAVCIWRLASGDPLRLVSKRFGLGISTCHKLVLEVCSAIKTVLMPKFLQWPDDVKLRSVKSEFQSLSGIPDVGGAMYTTHVPIIAPKISVAAYFNKRHTERNQKTSYSITVQGVVDHRGVFTDVCIGWPGSMPDDKVLEKSALHQRADRGLLKNVWLIGTAGHPLTDWVLVPYAHQNLTWTQHAFNEKVGELQGIAKEAFMRLKGRWSCLQKRTEVKLQDLPVVLGACCVLHNICEVMEEKMDETLRFDLFDDPMVPENSLRSVTSMQVRDHIAHNLLHCGLQTTSFM